ncbi:MAG: DNRLRE domain-containing protein [Clostridia bacterium]|nr:DNRLRE domain-containing protein [Clostridia bacterium]
MRKSLAMLLALLMLLPLFGCAAVENENDIVDVSSNIITGEEMENLAATGTSTKFSSTVAIEDAFVRSGSYASKVMAPEGGEDMLLHIKNNSGDYRRDVLLTFDLTKLDLNAANRILLCVYFEGGNLADGNKVNGAEEAVVVAYGIPSAWNDETVTYNTAPDYSESDYAGEADIPQQGYCNIDVTDYVFDQYDSGAKKISFRLVEKTVRTNQSEIFSTKSPKAEVHPVLRAEYVRVTESYVSGIYDDKDANDALWAYAQEMYDSWYARYQEILAKGNYTPNEKIVSPASDYSVTTQARAGTPTASIKTFKTRLVTTVKGYNLEDGREETVYGGDTTAERQEATGRYYTKKIDGRWWVIDPLGYPCYIRGINHINYSYQNGSPYQKEQMLKVYGSDEKWAISATRWIQNNYSINMASARDALIETVEDGLSYIVSAVGVSKYTSAKKLQLKGTPYQTVMNNTLPVFNPEWVEYAETQNKALIDGYEDKSRIFGYTTDNEIAYTITMLSQYLNLDPSVEMNVYSYACAWTWYKNMTGQKAPLTSEIEKNSKALGIDLQNLFLSFVYDRYLGVLSSAIKKADPDALYFGTRSLTGTVKNEWYLRTVDYWCDMYCFNCYNYWELDADVLYNMSLWMDTPFLVTEFYAKGTDAVSPLGESYPNRDGAGWVVETQEQRGEYYQNFCLRLLECKQSIGWMFFQYIDNDPNVNADASNKGMVNCDHDTEVYNDMNKQIALVNENVYGLIDFFDGQ